MHNKIKLFALLICTFFFAACTAKATVSIHQDKSAKLSLKTETGKTLEQIVTAFAGTDENKTLFDNEKLRAGFEKAGFTLDALTLSGKTAISLDARTADIRKTDTGGAVTIQNEGTSEILTIKLTPETLKTFLNLMPSETAEYTDFLMAPIFTGEKLSETEYAEIIGGMYGNAVRKELESSFFLLDISAPNDIISASLLPAGTGNVLRDGKKASFRAPLNKFLSNSKGIKICIQWKN